MSRGDYCVLFFIGVGLTFVGFFLREATLFFGGIAIKVFCYVKAHDMKLKDGKQEDG